MHGQVFRIFGDLEDQFPCGGDHDRPGKSIPAWFPFQKPFHDPQEETGGFSRSRLGLCGHIQAVQHHGERFCLDGCRSNKSQIPDRLQKGFGEFKFVKWHWLSRVIVRRTTAKRYIKRRHTSGNTVGLQALVTPVV